MNIYEVAFDMSKQNLEWQQAACQSNRQLVAYKLPIASTCCLLVFDMLLRHVAGVDGALSYIFSGIKDAAAFNFQRLVTP